MNRPLLIWTTELHYKTLMQLDIEGDYLYIATSGNKLFRLVSFLKGLCVLVKAKLALRAVYMPRIACFEFLFIRFLLRDKVILTTDGLADFLDDIEPRLNLFFFKRFYSRPVDIDISKFHFKSKDEIIFYKDSRSVVLYEKIPTNYLEVFINNSSYRIELKKKGDCSLKTKAKYIVTFSSTVVFEHLDTFPKSHILIIRASELELDPVTERRHLKYEEYFESSGFKLISLVSDNL